MVGTSQSAIRCLVAGRVQGVYYRAAARVRAEELGLSGWVRNLGDGRVEAVAQGTPEGVAAFAAWLWRGPPGARVDSVRVEQWTDPVAGGFVIAR